VVCTYRSFVGRQRHYVGTCCLQLNGERITINLTLNFMQVTQSFVLVRIGQYGIWHKPTGAERSVLSMYKTNLKLNSDLQHGPTVRYYVRTYRDTENRCSALSVGNINFIYTPKWYRICQIWFM
jgi:hypothetical protein